MLAAFALAGIGGQLIAFQVARHAKANQIGTVQRAFAADAIHVIWHDIRTITKALIGAQRITAVERATATHGITQTIGESPHAGSCHIALNGLLKTGVVGHFTEVPAFTVEVGIRVDLTHRFTRFQDLRFRVVTHQVETERIHFVVFRPHHQRVTDQASHHGVFRCGV